MDFKKLVLDHASVVKTSCKRKGVACAVLPELKWFYNGPINGDAELCSNEVGNCGCIHAEFHALRYCIWQNGYYSHEPKYSLLVNYSPCTSCANLIVASYCIERVYYVTLTEHDKRGIIHLEKGGVEVVKL